MDVLIKFAFKPINYGHPRKGNLEKGQKLFDAGHVVNLSERSLQINGKVIRQTSVSLPPYSVQLELNHQRDVIGSSCACIAGISGACKHISAVVVAINSEKGLSKTSFQCEWSKPGSLKIGQTKYSKGKRFEEIFVPRNERACEAVPLNFSSISTIPSMLTQALDPSHTTNKARLRHLESDQLPINSDDRTKFIKNLIERQDCSPLLTDLLNYPLHLIGYCCMDTYNKIIVCKSELVCQNTLVSRDEWKKERKYRITASRCYSLYTYSKSNWSEKCEKYFNCKDFSTQATRHGVAWEATARDTYKRDYKAEVVEVGLVVCQSDCWLAASPDGVIVDKNCTPIKLLEIKCPFKGNQMSASNILQFCNYLKVSPENGVVTLKKKHAYYAQVQVGMVILNVNICDFVLFCPFDKSIYVVEVPFDPEFCKSLLFRLKRVYFEKMIHTLC